MASSPFSLSIAGSVLAGLLLTAGPTASPEVPGPAAGGQRAGTAHSVRGGVTSTPEDQPPKDDAPARGSWPLRPPPPVITPFDRPEQQWSAGHRGADLLGRPGQPVHAALAGTVSYVGRIAGRGVVSVDHGPVRTTYQPVAATVRRGERVAEGQVIGRLLIAGSHCHPRACLHWGLIRGASHYLDPLTLVGAVPQPVRLHPW